MDLAGIGVALIVVAMNPAPDLVSWVAAVATIWGPAVLSSAIVFIMRYRREGTSHQSG